MSEHPVVDVTIIGAGPAGLAAAYYAGHREASCRIIESLEQLGGQVAAVYPEKHIFDIAGFPKVNGQEYIDGMVEQALQYEPDVHLGEDVRELERVVLHVEKLEQRWLGSRDGLAAQELVGLRARGKCAAGLGLVATNCVNAFSYGYDRLRFIRPVFIGDTIRTRVTVAAKEDDPKRAEEGRVIERCEVLNQRDEVVLAADHILIAERRIIQDSVTKQEGRAGNHFAGYPLEACSSDFLLYRVTLTLLMAPLILAAISGGTFVMLCMFFP